MMRSGNVIQKKSVDFALAVIELYKELKCPINIFLISMR